MYMRHGHKARMSGPPV